MLQKCERRLQLLSSVFFTLFFISPLFFPCILWTALAKGYGAPKLGSSWIWASKSFAMDSKELSSISYCFGDQKAIKTPKLNTIWLALIARVLNMLIGLKGNNYYSKVFKRVNYKLWNNTFWVVITNVDKHMTSVILSPSIRMRLKIQRKFIHQKDNRNQEGVYSKHTWKHFLPVRKSPLVFVFPDFPTGLFRASFLFPWKLSLCPSQ